MTIPARTRTDEAGVRWYQLPPDGVELPSSTSIIKALGKDALANWAGRRGVEATLAWVQPRADAAYRAGAPLVLPTLAERAHLAAEHVRLADAAAALGDAVHAACERVVLGQGAPAGGWHPRVAPFMVQFDDFLTTVRPEFLAAEETVYNRERMHAGTLDARAVIDGRPVVLDWKTSASATDGRPEWSLQLASYRHSTLRLVDGEERPAEPTDGAMVLRLRPKSWQLREVDSDELAYRAFLFIRGAWHWQHNMAASAVGPVLYRNT